MSCHVLPCPGILPQQGGGPQSKEKAEWMEEVTENWFHENRDIQAFEVEEFLGEILETEFQLQIDDGSLGEVGCHHKYHNHHNHHKYHNLCNNHNLYNHRIHHKTPGYSNHSNQHHNVSPHPGEQESVRVLHHLHLPARGRGLGEAQGDGNAATCCLVL